MDGSGADAARTADTVADTREQRLRAAREAAYRRDATAEDRARLAALEPVEAPEASAAARTTPATSADPPRRRPARATALVGVGALLVGALLGGTAVWVARPAPAPIPTPRASEPAPEPGSELRARILASNGTWSADDYYRFYPGQLPSEWSDSPTGRSYVQLTGPRRLRLSPSDDARSLLVVPTCAASEGRYRWTVRAVDGRPVASDAGACGGLDGRSLGIPDGARPLVLEITTQGSSGYAVTVFER